MLFNKELFSFVFIELKISKGFSFDFIKELLLKIKENFKFFESILNEFSLIMFKFLLLILLLLLLLLILKLLFVILNEFVLKL